MARGQRSENDPGRRGTRDAFSSNERTLRMSYGGGPTPMNPEIADRINQRGHAEAQMRNMGVRTAASPGSGAEFVSGVALETTPHRTDPDPFAYIGRNMERLANRPSAPLIPSGIPAGAKKDKRR